MDLTGRAAIVTGAARGIGRAAAERLLMAGANVVVSDVDEDATRDAVGELGEGTVAKVGDITAPGEPDAIVDHALDAFGRIDIVVNNAGYNWDSALIEMTDQQWEAMIAIHATAPFRLLRAAGRHMIAAAREEETRGECIHRKVVNLTSVSGTMGEPWQANYNAGKGAVLALSKGLAREWAEYRINVNAVAPGIVDTRLTQPDDVGEEIELHGERIPLGLSSERRRDLTDIVPLGRAGRPEEVADLILYLCSPASDYINGQVVSITGGLTMGMMS